MYDINEVAALFGIVEKATAHGNQFRNIRDAAMNALAKIDAINSPSAPQAIPAEQVEAAPADKPPAETPETQPQEPADVA